MKYNYLKQAFILAIIALAGVSCTKKESGPELEDGKSTVVRDVEGDVGNTVGGGEDFETFYFSFKTNGKVDKSKVLTADWDLAFANEYNSDISPNNATNKQSFGFGGVGKGALMVVNQAYDAVKTAPSDAEFASKGVDASGLDLGNGNGWYFYEMDIHIAIPVKNRTYVLKTADGKYAKLQMISMYKGAPSVVTSIDWPAPYLTFRYFVQQDGSTNLSTKD